jgi:iron complex outermembrane receptor protein
VKKQIALYFLICWAGVGKAQSSWIATGAVKDHQTKQPIDHCHIFLLHSTMGTFTSSEGKFEIEIRMDTVRLVLSHVGYKSDTIVILKHKNDIDFYLTPTQELLNEVIVTGVSKATLIKENPLSVAAISAKTIELSNENNIIDVLVKNTPGLNAVKTGPNISKPYIRGLGYHRVLTLYDGVRQEGQQWGDEHGIEVDSYNIEKAEVIKGPASLTYGSDALAGVVSLIPFKPKNDDGAIHGRWLSEYQSNNGLIGNGFRASSGNTHWLWAVRGAYRTAKNYFNSIDGRVFNTGFKEKNISALIGYKNTKGFSDFNLTLYDNLQGIPDGSRDSLTRKFTEQIAEAGIDQVKNRPDVSTTELNSYILSPLHQRIQHYRAYATNHYSLGKGEVHLLLAFSQNIRSEFNHPTDPKQAGMYVRLNTMNYSLRYNAPVLLKMETSVGVNGMFQNNKVKDATNFPIPDFSLADGGAFATSQWRKENWTISGGVRFDIRKIQIPDFFVSKNPNTGFPIHVFPPDTVGATIQFKELTQTFYGVSASLGSTYQFNEKLSLKVNIARGYRAPSIAEIASNGLDPGAHIVYLGNRNFIPEFNWQEDVGFFMNFSSVSASVSFFNNTIQHYIYLSQLTDAQGKPLTDPQGNKTFQYQQAAAQLYGLEGTFSWRPKNINGFSFNNQLALCYGFNRNPLFESKKQQGEYLPFIPPARWVSNLTQEFELKSTWLSGVNFSVEMDYNARQNRFLELFNTETVTPGYALLNLAAGTTLHQSQKSNWQFQLQVSNVLDVTYQSNMSRLKYFEYYQSSPSGRSGIYNMGRNLCAKIIFSF